MFEKLKGLIATAKTKLQQAKEKMDSALARVAGSLVLATASAGASAADNTALDTAIDALISGLTSGVTTTVSKIVPLLVLVFGFAFAIRWVRNTVGSK